MTIFYIINLKNRITFEYSKFYSILNSNLYSFCVTKIIKNLRH